MKQTSYLIGSRYLVAHMGLSPLALRLLLAGLIGISASGVKAAPVTLGFTAEVRSLPPFNDDVGLPFELEEGSIVEGLLTFDPDLGGPGAGNSSTIVQPFTIALSFDGFTFGTESFESTAINDSAILDGPSAGPADFILVQCASGSAVACDPNTVTFSDSPPLMLGFRMQLSGDESLLESPQLPKEIEIWNKFTIERSLRISFANSAGNGAVYDMTLSSFAEVPEPSSVCSFLACYAYLILSRRRR